MVNFVHLLVIVVIFFTIAYRSGSEVSAFQSQVQQQPQSQKQQNVSATVKLLPESDPTFFKCHETPTSGSSTLPGLERATSANQAVTDGNPNTEIFGKAIFDVSFSKPLINHKGPDLTIYEAAGNIEPFKVAVFNRDNSFTQFKQYIGTLTSITDDCQYGINAAQIDLSDFGVSEGDSISIVRVDNLGSPGCCTGADISDIIRVR